MAKLVAYALRNKPRWNRLEISVVTGMFSASGKRDVSTKDISV
jgi:hypothetical protein